MSNDAESIPIGRIKALLGEYENELKKVGEDTAEGRIYKRVRLDLRRATEGDD
jgi:hypothetical protein